MILYPFYAVTIALSVVVTLQPKGGIALHLYSAVLLIGLSWFFFVQITRQGVEVTPTALIIRNAFSTSTIKWFDIECFNTRQWFVNHEVMVVLTSGQRIRTVLIQGRVVAWKGGKTRDILSILRAVLTERTGACSGIA